MDANIPTTLHEAITYFSNPDNCLRTAIAMRWPDGNVVCPTCGSKFANTKSLPAGTTVRCPSCKNPITIGAAAGLVSTVSPWVAASSSPGDSAAGSSSKFVLICSLVGGGVLVILLVVALATSGDSRSASSTPQPLAAATGSPPAATSNPSAPASPAVRPPVPSGGFGRRPDTTISLVEARRGFQTRLRPSLSPKQAAPEPPPGVFRKVRYDAPPGALAAYVTPDPNDGARHPAIIWITGGDCSSIDAVWQEGPEGNEQTASAYRKAGLVMMFPSLRGGNDNPGAREGFLGEVDDVLAAARYLELQPYVDPRRIYLGGHSTGGTLVLLVAECTDRFRAVFSFGPVNNVATYPPVFLPFDSSTREKSSSGRPARGSRPSRARPSSSRVPARETSGASAPWRALRPIRLPISLPCAARPTSAPLLRPTATSRRRCWPTTATRATCLSPKTS